MARNTFAAACTVALMLATSASACIYLYGDAPNNLSPPTDMKYDFAMWGDNWSEDFEGCGGMQQSPINFPKGGVTGSQAPPDSRTQFEYTCLKANGSDVEVYNTGHNIQVQWDLSKYDGYIMVPFAGQNDSTVLDVFNYPSSEITEYARGYPIQFHFHTQSEHTMSGMYAPLEMHIVNVVPKSEINGCPESGCIVPVGIMFHEEDEKDNPILEKIFSLAPFQEGAKAYFPEGEDIDLIKLLPKNSYASYVQYQGSLTTPPCIEGFLWHVFSEYNYVSKRQMDMFMKLVSFKDCEETDDAESSNSNNRKASRKMLADEEDGEDMSNMTCSVGAYGYNARRVQARNDREVKWYSV